MSFDGPRPMTITSNSLNSTRSLRRASPMASPPSGPGSGSQSVPALHGSPAMSPALAHVSPSLAMATARRASPALSYGSSPIHPASPLQGTPDSPSFPMHSRTSSTGSLFPPLASRSSSNGTTSPPNETQTSSRSSSNGQPSDIEIERVIQAATSARPPPGFHSFSTSGFSQGGPGHHAVARDTRTQLFVGNLPYRVRWQDLKDLFRKAGTVLRADVSLGPDNRSRGYGTVLLATAEDAGRAVDMFNGYSWQTRILEVRPDRLPPDFDNPTSAVAISAGLSGPPSAFAVVAPPTSSLPPSAVASPVATGDFDFNAYFAQAQARVASSPDPHQPSAGDHESGTPGRNLFVGNLPFHCQWQDLKDLFRQAGTVVRADVALGQDGRSRGFGTVVFASDQDAERGVHLFNGYEYSGRALKVHYDKFSQLTQPLATSSTPSPFGQTLQTHASALGKQPTQYTQSPLARGPSYFGIPSSPYGGPSNGFFEPSSPGTPLQGPFAQQNYQTASRPGAPSLISMPTGYPGFGPPSGPSSPYEWHPAQQRPQQQQPSQQAKSNMDALTVALGGTSLTERRQKVETEQLKSTPPRLKPQSMRGQAQHNNSQKQAQHPGRIALPPQSFAIPPPHLSPHYSPLHHPMSPMYYPAPPPHMTPAGLPVHTPGMPAFQWGGANQTPIQTPPLNAHPPTQMMFSPGIAMMSPGIPFYAGPRANPYINTAVGGPVHSGFFGVTSATPAMISPGLHAEPAGYFPPVEPQPAGYFPSVATSSLRDEILRNKDLIPTPPLNPGSDGSVTAVSLSSKAEWDDEEEEEDNELQEDVFSSKDGAVKKQPGMPVGGCSLRAMSLSAAATRPIMTRGTSD